MNILTLETKDNRYSLYPYDPMILCNLVDDNVEMYKTKITADDNERFGLDTEMYGLKVGCLLSIKTYGNGERDVQHLSFMSLIVEKMSASLSATG